METHSETVRPSASLSLSNSQVESVYPTLAQSSVSIVKSTTSTGLTQSDSVSSSMSYSSSTSHSASASISTSPSALESPSKSESVFDSQTPSSIVTSSQSEAFAASLSVSFSTAVSKSVSASWSSSSSTSTSVPESDSLSVRPSASRSSRIVQSALLTSSRSQSQSQSVSLSVPSSASTFSSNLYSVSREVSSLEFLQSQPFSTTGSLSSSIDPDLSATLTGSQKDVFSSSFRSSATFFVSLSVSASTEISEAVSSTLSPNFSFSKSVLQTDSETVRPSASLSLSNSQAGSVYPTLAQSLVSIVASTTSTGLTQSDSVSSSMSYSSSTSHSASASISTSPSALESPSKSESVLDSQTPSSIVTSSQSETFAARLSVSFSTAVSKSVSASWSSSASISASVSESDSLSVWPSASRSSRSVQSALLTSSRSQSQSQSVTLSVPSSASTLSSNLYSVSREVSSLEFLQSQSLSTTGSLSSSIDPYLSATSTVSQRNVLSSRMRSSVTFFVSLSVSASTEISEGVSSTLSPYISFSKSVLETDSETVRPSASLLLSNSQVESVYPTLAQSSVSIVAASRSTGLTQSDSVSSSMSYSSSTSHSASASISTSPCALESTSNSESVLDSQTPSSIVTSSQSEAFDASLSVSFSTAVSKSVSASWSSSASISASVSESDSLSVRPSASRSSRSVESALLTSSKSQSQSQSVSLSVPSSASTFSSNLYSVSREVSSLEFLQSQSFSTTGSLSSSIDPDLRTTLTGSQRDVFSSSLQSSATLFFSLRVSGSTDISESVSSTLSPSFSFPKSVMETDLETVRPSASLSLSNSQVESMYPTLAQSSVSIVASTTSTGLTQSDSVISSMSYSSSTLHSASASISTGLSALESPSKTVSKSVSASWSSITSISTSLLISGRSSIDVTALETSSPSSSWSISPSKSQSIPLSTGSENVGNLYPYGVNQSDQELGIEDLFGYYRSIMCLEIKVEPYGLRFFGARHYKLHICRNGIIQTNNKWSLQWPRKFGVSYYVDLIGMFAPFWARSDQYQSFKLGISKVYYHIYDKSQSDHAQTGEILALASKHVEQYGGGRFANFEATWVLVVTWENLCPSVIYRYTYDGNLGISSGICAMRNTFQAVIITDWYNSFLMYNYPHGGIQWAFGVPSSYYKYWTNLYGLPVAGWNDPESGTKLNIKGSGSILGMYNLDKRMGNTDLLGRYFWRIESSDEKGAFEKCFSWVNYQIETNFIFWYYWRIRWDRRMACPCTFWQAFFDRGRFYWDWYFSWPEICFRSRRFFYFSYHGFGSQLCCYSTEWEDFGALKIGPPEGGHISVTRYNTYYGKTEVLTDTEAYKFCCVEGFFCDLFYQYRPSDTCQFYRPPPRPWFWGDPHIRTLDGGNYTFNGLGEYVMLDAQSGTFQLQARTGLARGNSTTGTIFVAGAAKEENTTTVEIRIKKDGGLHILFGGILYSNFSSLTNQSIEIAGNLSISKSEDDCLEVSFPSTTSVIFCARKEMLSFVVSPGDDYKNSTKGLLGTWNDNSSDDFTLPDGTVLSPSSTAREIHFGFGVKWQINQSQSLFTYAQNENTSTYAIPDFSPMFGDNITWQNDDLRKQAEEECGNDKECLFDVASTNDLSVGQATKDIGNQLSKELKTLDNFPPKILNVPGTINVTLRDTFMINVTAQDSDAVTFQVVNMPDSAMINQSGNILRFTWPVTSSRKLNLSFVATDDQGAASTWNPSINMCACEHRDQCVPAEDSDPVNTNSKFVYMGCACQGGYTGRFCDSEIDACEVNGQPCYEDVVCTDLPPPANETGYTCGPCPSGFTGNGAECSDFDECQSNQTNSCSQLCINSPGSYSCACQNGYSLNDDKESCDDINECVPTSDCMQRCHNTQGAYNCSCDESFKSDPSDWRKCEAINPCEVDLNCSQVCYTDNNNTATCACFANYELQSDGKTCLDIDECNSTNHLTLCDQICENIPGSYKCSCKKGFNLINNRRCEDINECIDEDYFNCTDPLQYCVNTPGSHKCECEKGLQLIDGKCQDIDECNFTKPLTPCDQICENIPGSYKCSCQDGFNLVNGSRCEDINECIDEDYFNCSDPLQHCVNTPGSYKCECEMGLQQIDGKCQDIDECNSTNHLTRCDQICENILGSYKCSCQEGFNLVNGSRCEDNDECNSTKRLTPCDQICENIPGSYNCSCQKGFNLVNGSRCEVLEKNETVIVPELPTPRAPSKDEREQAVKITVLANSTSFKWDFHTDKNFKEKLASFVSSFCSVNRRECAIKETSRERRAHPNHLYTAEHVHLLPGYPSNASGSLKLQIAVYVQQPQGMFLTNVSVLPSKTLLTIILQHKSELGASIGAIILDAEVLFKPTTSPPTSSQTEDTDSGYSGWLLIAACLGAVVILVVIILAICILRRRNRRNHALPQLQSYASRSEDIVEMSFYNITSKEHGKDCEDGEKPV
ncbi:uncharacterized protein LOC141877470 isoform X2 [Acropora palmata]|uniref:uncharacterized protein LOC141877470 isoform X2 n=1 Tax=Acropora palmata TaxID=6131 RepID=UPI003DA0EB1D